MLSTAPPRPSRPTGILTMFTISRHSRARPAPGTRTEGGCGASAGQPANRRRSSAVMRPYDCARSAAPSADQSRAQFFSTYLQQGGKVHSHRRDSAAAVQQLCNGCPAAALTWAPGWTPLAPDFVVVLWGHSCPHLVLILVGCCIGGRQVGRRPAAVLLKHGQHRR